MRMACGSQTTSFDELLGISSREKTLSVGPSRFVCSTRILFQQGRRQKFGRGNLRDRNRLLQNFQLQQRSDLLFKSGQRDLANVLALHWIAVDEPVTDQCGA